MLSPLDEFAKAALTGIVTRSPGATPQGAASAAYEYAKAMVEEQRRLNQLRVFGKPTGGPDVG